MERTGIRYFNSYYVETPEALLKICELVFGGGAWGPIIINSTVGSGPFTFFVWATFGSWMLVLLSFLLGFCKLSVQPKSDDQWRIYAAPNLGDLVMNAGIALTVFIALVVFGVYSLPSSPVNSLPVFVMIITTVTFLIHLFHALTLVLYVTMGAKRWTQEKRWIWQRERNAKKTAQQHATARASAAAARSSKPDGDSSLDGYENQISPDDVEIRQSHDHEIYQDVS